MLEDPNWKYDIVPEFMDGKNIGDFIDPEILARLDELEKEEEQLDEARKNLMEDDDEIDPELLSNYKGVRQRKALIKLQHKLKKHKRAFPKNKELADVKEKLLEKGVDTKNLEERVKNKRRPTRLSQLRREEAEEMEEEENGAMRDEEEEKKDEVQKNLDRTKRSISRSKSKGFKVEKTEMARVINLFF